MRQIKLLLICGLVCAVVFSGFSLVFYFGDWLRIIFVAGLGLFVGFLAAPELEPQIFKSVWLIQLMCGVIAGLFVGLVFDLNSVNIIYTSIIGGFLGWSANLWVKHVPIP